MLLFLDLQSVRTYVCDRGGDLGAYRKLEGLKPKKHLTLSNMGVLIYNESFHKLFNDDTDN